MRARTASIKALRALCEEIGPGNGQHPRHEVESKRQGFDRKTYQLCKQVATALDMGLRQFDLLDQLYVGEVHPNPDAGHLLVILHPEADHLLAERGFQSALNKAKTQLREEVACFISRKRVPHLAYRIQPQGEVSS